MAAKDAANILWLTAVEVFLSDKLDRQSFLWLAENWGVGKDSEASLAHSDFLGAVKEATRVNVENDRVGKQELRTILQVSKRKIIDLYVISGDISIEAPKTTSSETSSCVAELSKVSIAHDKSNSDPSAGLSESYSKRQHRRGADVHKLITQNSGPGMITTISESRSKTSKKFDVTTPIGFDLRNLLKGIASDTDYRRTRCILRGHLAEMVNATIVQTLQPYYLVDFQPIGSETPEASCLMLGSLLASLPKGKPVYATGRTCLTSEGHQHHGLEGGRKATSVSMWNSLHEIGGGRSSGQFPSLDNALMFWQLAWVLLHMTDTIPLSDCPPAPQSTSVARMEELARLRAEHYVRTGILHQEILKTYTGVQNAQLGKDGMVLCRDFLSHPGKFVNAWAFEEGTVVQQLQAVDRFTHTLRQSILSLVVGKWALWTVEGGDLDLALGVPELQLTATKITMSTRAAVQMRILGIFDDRSEPMSGRFSIEATAVISTESAFVQPVRPRRACIGTIRSKLGIAATNGPEPVRLVEIISSAAILARAGGQDPVVAFRIHRRVADWARNHVKVLGQTLCANRVVNVAHFPDRIKIWGRLSTVIRMFEWIMIVPFYDDSKTICVT